MPEFSDAIILTSPHEHGQRVKDAQYTLNGHNFFGRDWLAGPVDGVWGLESGQAADQARYELGYPADWVHTQVFGQPLFGYLRTDGNRKKLPAAYLVRRILRLRRAQQSVKEKALAWALTKVGVEEHPPGSNRCEISEWFGYIGPWCAMLVTEAFVVGGGDRNVFTRGVRTASAYWPEWMARVGRYGLRITSNPEPGDIVVYHYRQGHVGIFRRWTNRSRGEFETVEGNTSVSSDDNGGAVKIRQRRVSWCPTVFVRFPS